MTPPPGDGGQQAEIEDWRSRTRIFLRPIAAPSILGLFGFAGATFIVAAHLAGWYGTESPQAATTTVHILFPFAAAFGGIAQFAAAMWGYIARDGIATAMHGMWGAFWIAFGILFLLSATGTIALSGDPAHDAFGFWFFALAAITACGAAAAAFENIGLTAVLGTLATGAAFLGIGYYTGSPPAAGEGWIAAGGWVLVASAILATYTAAALMLKGANSGKTVLPLGEYKRAANIPGEDVTEIIQFERGEVGVKHGQ